MASSVKRGWVHAHVIKNETGSAHDASRGDHSHTLSERAGLFGPCDFLDVGRRNSVMIFGLGGLLGGIVVLGAQGVGVGVGGSGAVED